ncbi:hypothetical protein ACFWMQ_25725 [Streptomyces sp. NPDC058372]|uniref:hypothetical protein n=1 Tax=Streptomyces sp. NPDC058372 TaxID=3346464 RepID=UPI00364DAFB4
MNRLHTFVARNLWFQVLLSILGASGLVLLISPGQSPSAVLGRVAVSSLGGVAVLLAVRRKEKRATGTDTTGLVSLDRRLRTGEVPADPAEREALRALVAKRLHRARNRPWALAFLVLLFGGVAVLTALTAGPRETIGFTLLAVAFPTWLFFNGRKQLRRLRRMREALDGAPRPGAGPGGTAYDTDRAGADAPGRAPGPVT